MVSVSRNRPTHLALNIGNIMGEHGLPTSLWALLRALAFLTCQMIWQVVGDIMLRHLMLQMMEGWAGIHMLPDGRASGGKLSNHNV